MHLSDGVLSVAVSTVTSITAGALLIHSTKSIKEEEIPRISLMSAAFFGFSLISIPVGPSSIHLLLAALLGIVLGKRSTLAIFIGLLLQAVFFQHGGLTTLGANTLIVAIPALVSYKLYTINGSNRKLTNITLAFIGGFAVVLMAILLMIMLILSNSLFNEGVFSVINILILGNIPLVIIEAFITVFAVSFIHKVRPNVLEI